MPRPDGIIWQCPACGFRCQPPQNTEVPDTCPQCGCGRTDAVEQNDTRFSKLATITVTAALGFSSSLTLIIGGVSGTTFLVAVGHIGLVVLLAWFVHRPRGRTAARWVTRRLQAGCTLLCVVGRRLKEWYRECREQRRRAAEERRRRQTAEQRRREREQQRRREEIARALRPVREAWRPRDGIETSETETYGIGLECVYCYSYRRTLELARLKQQPYTSIKVGMAGGNPIDRIQEQISASKTAISDQAVVLLVFRTGDCRHLERWLHNKLRSDPHAQGREWFLTTKGELVALFRQYLERHFVPPRPPTAAGEEGIVAEEAFLLRQKDFR